MSGRAGLTKRFRGTCAAVERDMMTSSGPSPASSTRWQGTLRAARRTVTVEMSTPHHDAVPSDGESLELPVDELLRRGRPHLPYGEQVIDDLTPEEGEAFLDAVRS